MGQEGEALSKR